MIDEKIEDISFIEILKIIGDRPPNEYEKEILLKKLEEIEKEYLRKEGLI